MAKYKPVIKAPLPLPGIRKAFGVLVDDYTNEAGVSRSETFRRIADITGNSPNGLYSRYRDKYNEEWVFSDPQGTYTPREVLPDPEFAYDDQPAISEFCPVDGLPELADLKKFVEASLESRHYIVSERFDVDTKGGFPDCHQRHRKVLSRFEGRHPSWDKWLRGEIEGCDVCGEYEYELHTLEEWRNLLEEITQKLSQVGAEIQKSYVKVEVESVQFKCHRCGDVIGKYDKSCHHCSSKLDEVEAALWENYGAEIIDEQEEAEWQPVWNSETPSTQLATRYPRSSTSSRGE